MSSSITFYNQACYTWFCTTSQFLRVC